MQVYYSRLWSLKACLSSRAFSNGGFTCFAHLAHTAATLDFEPGSSFRDVWHKSTMLTVKMI